MTALCIPADEPARTEALQAIAADLVEALGPGAALRLATVLDELVAELPPQRPPWLRQDGEAA